MRKIHTAIALFLILVGGFTISTARAFPKMDPSDVGAGFFPEFVSYLLILLAVILLLSGFWYKEEYPESDESGLSRARPLYGMVGTALYVLFVYIVGFYIATVAFLIIIMWLLKFRGVFRVLIATGIVTLFVYGVFEMILKVPMPTSGLFG